MLKKFLFDTVFPQFCLRCGREGGLVCKDCLGLIEIADYQYCPFCNFPNRVIGKGKCPSHQKMKLNGLFSATSYKDALVKKLIGHFKYKPYLKTLAQPLSSLIIAHFLLTENKTIFQQKENSLFVPVPLIPGKEKERGFNQAALLAEELSRFFEMPVLNKNLSKIKKTPSQTGLKRKEREKNIQGAFAVKNAQPIAGKRIFLVDDIFTTGATMEECAKVLKEAGGREVWGIAVAREPLE